jgi:hypothetical protein
VVRHANLLKIPTHIIEHQTCRNSKSLDLVPRYAESFRFPQKIPPPLKKLDSFQRSKPSMTNSPLDRHRTTPAENYILDFLSCLSQFREDFTADIEIACNSLNRDEANRTPRMVTGSRSVRTSHPVDDGAWFHGQVLAPTAILATIDAISVIFNRSIRS